MQKEIVSVVYDRRKEVTKCGRGAVEIRFYLGNGIRKYVTVHSCDPFEWKEYQRSEELRTHLAIYRHIVATMEKNGEELTIENINSHIGLNSASNREKREVREKKASKTGFIDFMKEQIAKEDLKPNTMKRRYVVIEALKRYGKLNSFADLTHTNVKGFDDFLRNEDPTRTQPTIHDYHKVVHKFTRLAFQYDFIPKDPYEHPLCKFKRGQYKERRPLLEDELLKIRNIKLRGKEARIRDLFVFCAYTGLSYIDSQNFDYDSMTETINGQTYIDGKRTKTGNAYFTPILPPAMEVLKRYDYEVPHISNQKANDYLHAIEVACNIKKPMTMHVARHSFATLALSYDIPIEDVGRMLGQKNIRTTQIYAKILKSTIERHSANLASLIK
jgi:site-specific recombinase XerD